MQKNGLVKNREKNENFFIFIVMMYIVSVYYIYIFTIYIKYQLLSYKTLI